MRTTEVLLDGFENIKILQQYLYMSEDHFIDVTNVIGVVLRIRMGDDLRYHCTNLNFPDLEPLDYSSDMTVRTMLDIIAQLKETKPTESQNAFETCWEEIKSICTMNVAQNQMKRRT